MKTFLSLILGIAIGVAIIWFVGNQRSGSGTAGGQNPNPVQSAANSISDKLHSLHLSGSDIKEELAKTGRVIREKSEQVGQKISDATADSRATATIKAKLVGDPDLSAWDISVNTTDGVVTLSGSVSSEENIGKAVLLALETDHVRQVISTLQVKGPKLSGTGAEKP